MLFEGAIYGELTMVSMQKIVNVLKSKCDMNSDSRFIDVGAGLGKPNFHVAQDPAVRISIGVELEKIRWQVYLSNQNKDNKMIMLLNNIAIDDKFGLYFDGNIEERMRG